MRAYAEAVVAGEIIAGPHVRNACRRHLHDLKHGAERGLWFDHDAADQAFLYFESVLKLSEGQFEGEPFTLAPSQAFIVGSLFGWKQADGRRRFSRAYVEQGKGNGKSPMAGGIGLKGLASDGEAGAQIYAAASTRQQANVLFSDAVKMVKKSPALKKRLMFSGGEGREFNIAHHPSGSFFRPVSRETGRTGAGPRPYFVLADELHEMPDRRVLETLERGFKFRREPLLFMITNSGSDRNSVCWEEHEHAIKVAAGNPDAVTDPTFIGDPVDDRTFSYVCALDVGDDPLQDPSCWIKANPLLGVTITEEYLAAAVKQAKDIPGKLNGILRLHFCVWTDAETAWMTRATLEPCIDDFDPVEHRGLDVWLGLDLSQHRDITALAAVVRTGTDAKGKPLFDAWVEAWTPGDTVQSRELRDKLPYTKWINDGDLQAPKGESIDFLQVGQAIAEYDRDFRINLIAYDRYAFRRFEDDIAVLGMVDIPFAEHPQGGTKKGRPIVEGGEGLWMPASLRLLEEALLERRIRLRRNQVLISAMMSAVTVSDRWDNRWIARERSANKIDAAVALCMAVGAASVTDMETGSIYERLAAEEAQSAAEPAPSAREEASAGSIYERLSQDTERERYEARFAWADDDD